MDYNAAALEMHAKYPGKLIVNSLFEVKDRDALSTAYTPGVAEPCRQIKANPDDVYKYTFKGRTVAVVTNGTAVLGLGNIGPEAGLPVMEGKCVLFKEFGGVDAFPICLNASTREEVIAAVKAIAPTFGGINLEDIRSPECFDIEAELERDLDIPVFHDDQHGTAIIVLAGVLNALKVVGKRLEDVKIVQNGPGAAGTAIIKMLQVAGAKNIVAVDEHGILYPGRPAGLADHKEWLATVTGGSIESDGLGTLLTTSECLLSPNRNGQMSRDEIEDYLCSVFHLKQVLWLNHGYLAGDDTDSHVDTLARLCSPDTIAYVQCTDTQDEHYEALHQMEEQLKIFRTLNGNPYRLLALPMVDKIEEEGERLPATYANFLIMNDAVLYPTYRQPENDQRAKEVLQAAFPHHEIVGVDCCALIKQHGSLHCVTMQYPVGIIA